MPTNSPSLSGAETAPQTYRLNLIFGQQDDARLTHVLLRQSSASNSASIGAVRCPGCDADPMRILHRCTAMPHNELSAAFFCAERVAQQIGSCLPPECVEDDDQQVRIVSFTLRATKKSQLQRYSPKASAAPAKATCH
jgi:hypothetical protein